MKEDKSILISAYSFAPKEGSEPNFGFNVATKMLEYFNVTVLSAYHYKKRCEKNQKDIPENLEIHFIKVPILWRIYEKQGTLFRTIYYYIWQFFAYKKAKEIHAKKKFILAHHVTFGKFSIPSLLHNLKIPLIFGSCGGAEKTPLKVYQTLNFKYKLIELIRLLSIKLTKFDPFLRHMYKKSKFCFATSEESYYAMKSLGAKNVKIMNHVALTEDEINYIPEEKFNFKRIGVNNQKNIFISCGRPLYWKGFDLGIESFAQLNDPNSVLIICSFGGETKNLEKKAKDLNISNRVYFIKNLIRSEVMSLFSEATALIHPSYHDSGGFVIAEAQAMGLPVICLNCGGPSIILDDKAGFKIDIDDKDRIIKEISNKMKLLIKDESLKNKLSKNGKLNAKNNLSWNSKINNYYNFYKKILN